jgi:signal peptidase I
MSGAGRGMSPGAGSDEGVAPGERVPTQRQQAVPGPDGVSRPAGGTSGPDASSSSPGGSSRGPAEASSGAAGPAGAGATGGDARGEGPDGASRADGDDAAGGGPQTPGPGDGRRRHASPPKKRSFWREFPILVVVALLLAVIIKTYAIQAFFIPSGSMQNTLEINDRVLVNKLVYDTRSIHRGDIVVFNGDGSWDPGTVPTSENFLVKFYDGFASMFGFGHPGDILIKRVIGLPGDKVACCDAQGRVTVNGVALSEGSYLYPGNAPSEVRFSIQVPPGRLWVMGDHRLISDDSRDHLGDPGGGTVPESAVVGRAFVIIWPVNRWRILPIPATFQQPQLNAAAGPPALSGTQDTAAAADVVSARLEPSGPAVPLSLGFATAIPVTWLQRRVRLRAAARRASRREPGSPGT